MINGPCIAGLIRYTTSRWAGLTLGVEDGRVADAFAHLASEADEAFCARFGGEEFMFALRQAGELEAARMARCVLQAIVDIAVPHPARSDGIGVGIVTVGIGVARCEVGVTRPLQDILAAAYISLCSAKRWGRNRFALENGIGPSVQIAS